MYRLKAGFFLLIAWFACFAHAGPLITNTHLYEIRKDNRVSHMLGTIHIGVGVKDLPTSVLEIFTQHKLHVFEYYGSELNVQKEYLKQNQLAKDFAHFSRGITEPLPAYRLSSEQKARLLKFGLPGFFVDKLATNRCGLLIRVAEAYRYDLSYSSLDLELLVYSLVLPGTNRGALETLQDRIDARKLAGEKTQICDSEEFDKLIQDIEENRAVLRALEVYVSGDEYSEAEGSVLIRNQNWIDNFNKYHAVESTFFSVGVRHLYGSGGLIKLLEKDGWGVSRVNESK